ncbi:MAG: hypothetical protein LBC96_05605 [Lachnospiraceae bacterium]|jgi:hypothetical protein|nr:hypothetical protein [Lachnospiraceae bacterium]
MNILRRIAKYFRPDDKFPPEFELWNEVVQNRSNIAIHKDNERREYVQACLDQLKDAAIEVESLRSEYNVITSLLKDMEEIEAMPPESMTALVEAATRLNEAKIARAKQEQTTAAMNEATYRRIDALSEEVEAGLAKMKEAEEHRGKINQDMKYLNGEKEAYTFRRVELQRLGDDLRTVMVICLTAVGVLVVLLLFMQFFFEMNTRVGYLLTAAIASFAITGIFIKYNNSRRELKRVEVSINKLILLHNSVKIRYINNTNLLEYMQIKYGVRDNSELQTLYQQYLTEKNRRAEYKLMEGKLDAAEMDLVKILRYFKLFDPIIWIHQTEAILDKREMVEVRHKLIIRRQSLRKRIDYNHEVVAKRATEEVKELVNEYPQYATEIMTMVREYEQKYC